MPELSIHAEVGMTDRITRFLIEGVVHAALLYTPQLRPGLTVEPALDDELVLVASYPGASVADKKEYVSVDWGPEFTHALAVAVPHLTDSGRSMALGSLVVQYIATRRATAYVPARSVQHYLGRGKLEIVSDAPRFPYPSWVVWRDDLDNDLATLARNCLKNIVQTAESEQKNIVKNLLHIDDYAPFLFNTMRRK
ncbi:LysR substrate binding domain protein [Thalassovita gelatinovora]|uniref:LysR substrate binding domain protein n=1 Tax=Thalassovita gelatinovora TaxID=53501 RepID=A0A0P1FHQ0_THAGE|nr:LysR substrate-binding domain-containing protein [Thalassovita gelatinovora]CUH67441.1 LysR substrate binding domain protein [Thalassovita gelatinovora]SEP73939.1 LysR substrate binding domain-containing protein [Thalassovita gelatinovora]